MEAIEQALRAILAEVTPGQRPYSGDSYLPDHLIEKAQQALAAAQKGDKEAPRGIAYVFDHWEEERGQLLALMLAIEEGLNPDNNGAEDAVNQWRLAQIGCNILGNMQDLSELKRLLVGAGFKGAKS